VNDNELDELLEDYKPDFVAFAPDDGYFVKFEDGSNCWENIPTSLHNKINGRQKRLPEVKSLCIGEDDAWIVQFEDGSWAWNELSSNLDEVMEEINSLDHFSFSPSMDSYMVTTKGGRIRWCSNKLSQILEDHMDPDDIRFTQSSIKDTFSDGRSLYGAVKKLKCERIEVYDFPTIHVFYFYDSWWSLDNRRLWTFKKAGLDSIPIKKVEISKQEFLRMKVIDDGESIYIR
jgi:hypothetical protein